MWPLGKYFEGLNGVWDGICLNKISLVQMLKMETLISELERCLSECDGLPLARNEL